MPFELRFTEEAEAQLEGLKDTDKKKAKKVGRTLGYLETNPRHPGLQTHEYQTLTAAMGVKVFEAYVENKTPGAYRVFWYYGPEKGEITIISITPHP